MATTILKKIEKTRIFRNSPLFVHRDTGLLASIFGRLCFDYWRFEGFLGAFWRLFRGFLEAFWKLLGCFLKASWGLFGGFLEDFWRLFEGFLGAFWRLFEGFLRQSCQEWVSPANVEGTCLYTIFQPPHLEGGVSLDVFQKQLFRRGGILRRFSKNPV